MQVKVAVLGGSFDPVHSGHLHIANQILQQKAAERVLFVPSGNHHFKKTTIVLPFEKRFALVQKAIQHNPCFAVSDADQEGSGYTAHLIQKLCKLYPEVDFSFVIGADNLEKLRLWYDYPYLAKELHFIILPRPGYPLLPKVINQLKATVLNIELCSISATDIRQRIKNGESIQGMVPEELEQEITWLYQEII